MRYFVQLIPQLTTMGCWAASIAMIRGWADQTSIDPGTIAARDGYQQYLSGNGLPPSDDKILRDWGIIPEAPQSYTVAGFMELLQRYGPLWVAGTVGGGAHVRVVTGFDPDPDSAKATVWVNDPWQQGMRTFSLPNTGSAYSQSYLAFTNQQDRLARSEMKEVSPIYVAHLPTAPRPADLP
jgi:hypothetical protein